MMRAALALGLMLGLCACTMPQKINLLRQDKARFDRQQDERAAYERCSRDAMPGTTQHMACRMAGSN